MPARSISVHRARRTRRLRRLSLDIVRDTPGALLVLEGQDPSLPAAFGALVGGMLAMVGQEDALWRPSRLAADRQAGTLELIETHAAHQQQRREGIPLGRIVALRVRRRHWWPPSDTRLSPAEAAPNGLEASIRIDEGSSARERSFWFRVDGIETLAGIADFAFRLGAAMGLRRQRVVKSDPRRIEIELTRDGGAGSEPIPTLPPADYRRHVVCPEATHAVAEEIVPAFEPSAFPSDHRVARWSPGEEVRFEKPLEGFSLGCLPVLLAGVALGPAVSAFAHNPTATLVATSIGVLVAAVSLFVIARSLPHRVTLDWASRTLTKGGPHRRVTVPFDQLAALELRCVHTFYGGSQVDPHAEYHCEIRAHLRGATADGVERQMPLIATTRFRSDPETPYDQALALATELAHSLGVERRVTDYTC